MVMGELTRATSRPSSPSLQEKVLKAGWLKKQRSIMKNWQLRWFVLRTDHLYFYKDEEETKPQVSPKGYTYYRPESTCTFYCTAQVVWQDYGNVLSEYFSSKKKKKVIY